MPSSAQAKKGIVITTPTGVSNPLPAESVGDLPLERGIPANFCGSAIGLGDEHAGLVAADVGRDEVAMQLFDRVALARLAWPPLPADAVAEQEIVARLGEQHGEEWTRRAGALASTWNSSVAVSVASDLLRSIVGAE